MWLGALLGLLWILVDLPYTVCPFANLVGYPCPGCGMTRAGLALFHGDLKHAFAFHPLSFVGVPLVVLWSLHASLKFLFGRSLRSLEVLGQKLTSARSAWLWWCLLALLLGVWVARFSGSFGGPATLHLAPGAPRVWERVIENATTDPP